MRLLCSALLSANLLLGSSFSLLSPYHFLCQDNILPKNIFSFERTFVLSETPAESTPAADSSDVLNLSAPSVLLMEASTGTILYEKNSHTVLRPASITKIMTLILIFDAIESGQISLEETVMHAFIATAGVFVTCMFPIHQFLYLFSASYGLFSIPLRHTRNLSLPKTSSGKCSNRTGCSLPS